MMKERLQKATDKTLEEIAEKSLKETKYHLKQPSEWIIRMGDGTDESHTRVQNALNTLWRYSSELFYSDETDRLLLEQGVLPDMSSIQLDWNKYVNQVFEEAGITIPSNNWKHEGGRIGMHSEHLGYILAELQFMQRAYPNMEW